MSKEKLKFVTLDAIKKKHARYNILFGERSNGKTTAVLGEGVDNYFKDHSQMAIIRRYDEDFVGANSARTCFNSLICDAFGRNQIEEKSNGEYTGVEYYAGKYYLTQRDESTGKERRTDNIIAYGFALTASEHYKSASFPNVRTVLFDEFMTRKFYLHDEFILFQNVLSTIIRTRDDVTIYMCANTVNKYGCPYFNEMGLYRIKEMRQGDIDAYTYGDSGLVVAVQWTDGIAKKKPSDVYFAFNNPRLNMITKGSWEMDIYPHCPEKYVPKDIAFTYFINYEDQLLQCEIVMKENKTFTFIHRKTTPLKKEGEDLIYSTEYDTRRNYRRRITVPMSELDRKILWYYNNDKVFYQDNDVGEVVRNYLQWCKR